MVNKLFVTEQLRPTYTFSLHLSVQVFTVLQSKTARQLCFVRTEVKSERKTWACGT